MTFTQVQSDFLLDIYAQCQLVSGVIQQMENATEDEADELKKLYGSSIGKLNDLCNDALLHGLDEPDIRAVTDKHLPSNLELCMTP